MNLNLTTVRNCLNVTTLLTDMTNMLTVLMFSRWRSWAPTYCSSSFLKIRTALSDIL